MALPDFSNYDDEKLEDARLAILNEKERRDRLTNAPQQVAAIAQRYMEDGKPVSDLIDALSAVE